MKFKRLTRWSMGGALVAFFVSQPMMALGSEEGKKLFQQKCAECHAMAPTQKVTLAELKKIKGTPLWFAGSKFQKEWLSGWLAKPTPLLSVTWNSSVQGTNEHPAVPAAEAAKITDYLMTAVDDKMEAGKAAAFPKKRSQKRKFLTKARGLFEKHQGCYACHRYLNKRNLELGGFSGPTLVSAKDRLQGDWVYSFLQNRERYYPNSRCAIPGPKSVNKYTDKDKEMLAGYVVNIGVK